MSDLEKTDSGLTSEAEGIKKQIYPQKTYRQIIKSSFFYEDVSKIVHWRDPFRTGLLFGIFNFFFFLITWGEYTVITLTSYLLLALLAVCFIWANGIVLRGRYYLHQEVENPFKDRYKKKIANSMFQKEKAEEIMATSLELTNLTIDVFRDVFYCSNNILSLKFALGFYFVATIGSWFGGATLIYLALLALFIWPRLYEEKQKEIDHYCEVARCQVNTYINVALQKIEPITAKFGFKPKQN